MDTATALAFCSFAAGAGYLAGSWFPLSRLVARFFGPRP